VRVPKDERHLTVVAGYKWRGVKWASVHRGVCRLHNVMVGMFTGLCFACHQAQLEAAQRGSREWEREA
jgi:hypothetical protein